jgi:hypothetical protein
MALRKNAGKVRAYSELPEKSTTKNMKILEASMKKKINHEGREDREDFWERS